MEYILFPRDKELERKQELLIRPPPLWHVIEVAEIIAVLILFFIIVLELFLVEVAHLLLVVVIAIFPISLLLYETTRPLSESKLWLR